MKLTDFKVLTFDCYGTLIDWETGIWNALQPLLSAGGLALEREDALVRFGDRETEQEEERRTEIDELAAERKAVKNREIHRSGPQQQVHEDGEHRQQEGGAQEFGRAENTHLGTQRFDQGEAKAADGQLEDQEGSGQ